MTLELEATLQKRLKETNSKKDDQMDTIKKLQAKLQTLLKKIPRRPKDSLAELDKKIEDLERKRTINSVPLAEERQILKEIMVVKRNKSQVEEYFTMENQVQELKKQLDEIRDGLRGTLAAAGEVSTALSKVKIANKLECQSQELTKKEIECPKAKLGKVIGKGGATISKIQTSCKVEMDVDTDKQIITITGSESSIQAAVDEIDKIVQLLEEEIAIDKNLVQYLTAKYVDVLERLREEYPESFVDVLRGSGKLLVRGAPEDVATIKAKMAGLQVLSKTMQLQGGKEAAILLGKKGATVDKLCERHSVFIDVSKGDEDSTTAFVLGFPNSVDAALGEIKDLMNDNRDASEQLEISSIMKNILLADNGRQIKAVQSMVSTGLADGMNCYVTVSKETNAKENADLIVKTKQSSMPEALELTKSQLKAIEHLVSSLTVDPFIVPRVIGKGGATIKRLTSGKDTFIEVDKESGEIQFGASTLEGLEEIRSELQVMVANNSIVRLPLSARTMKDQHRDLSRSNVRTELAGKVRVDLDEEKSCLVLTGKSEELEHGKALVEEFIANNQIGEVPVTEEDREVLITGGKSSKIVKLSEESNVKMHIDRENHLCLIRGSKQNVESAVNSLKQYLEGGNGHSVVKLAVSQQVVGAIIGKKGKTIQELEMKHQGVTINISKSHVVTIRGPEEGVSGCKVHIGKMIASARVAQDIPVTDSQKEILEKKEFRKKICQQIPVSVSIMDNKVTVRGSFYDVQDAVSLVNEMITGEYKTAIELDSLHFSKVRNTCCDPSHVQRMETVSGGKIDLDLSGGTIVISGKRANVKKAKDQVYGFLDFILPGVFERVEISKPLYLSVGQSPVLAEIASSAGGVTAYLDRDLGMIVLRSSVQEKLQKAKELLTSKISESELLVFVKKFTDEDSWILATIIGKNGSKISSLRKKNPTCKIDVSKEDQIVTVVGDTEEAVKSLKEAVEAMVEQARQENIFLNIPETYVPQFVGKGGSNVKALSVEHGAEIQRIKRGPYNFKISGQAPNVEATKAAVEEWLSKKEEADAVLTFHLEKDKDVAYIIGEKGGFIRSVQDSLNCRVDIDRKALIVNVKGGTPEIRESAASKLKDKIVEERKKLALRKESQENKLQEMQRTPKADFTTEPPLKLTPDTACSEEKTRSRASTQESVSSNEYPSQPIGIASPRNSTNSKKNHVSINEGTFEGKSLFAMLLAED